MQRSVGTLAWFLAASGLMLGCQSPASSPKHYHVAPGYMNGNPNIAPQPGSMYPAAPSYQGGDPAGTSSTYPYQSTIQQAGATAQAGAPAYQGTQQSQGTRYYGGQGTSPYPAAGSTSSPYNGSAGTYSTAPSGGQYAPYSPSYDGSGTR